VTPGAPEVPELYHFTSAARAHLIDLTGWLLPGNDVLLRAGHTLRTEVGVYVWLISEPNPTPRLVGFSDSSEHLTMRYEALNASAVQWWPTVRRQHTPELVELLESYAMPALWWVSRQPVRVGLRHDMKRVRDR
jgi:hypothetical protein